MKYRLFLFVAILLLWKEAFPQTTMPSRSEIFAALKTATKFFDEKVNSEGRFVWYYTLDLSRRWGELEAYPSMAWLQGQGSVDMGETFLDLYEATGDHYYLQLAFNVAKTLVEGQLPCGGWNYMIDFSGEESLRRWYSTIGKNGWRLEEFHYYYGNATFDDGVTYDCAMFLLRLEVLKPTPEVRSALEKVLSLIKESQYPIGAWPQRYPHVDSLYRGGYPSYPKYYTFNDDVTWNNIRFLIMCEKILGDTTLNGYIQRGMDFYILSQLPPPQAGWAMQYTYDLRPAPARSYEPAALDPIYTGKHIEILIKFYEMTGCKTYLECIPPALQWLESVVLEKRNGVVYVPKFVEIGTNEPLYTHRRGSNRTYGAYYVDKNPEKTLAHYRSVRPLRLDELKKMYTLALQTNIQYQRGFRIPEIDTLDDTVRKYHRLRDYLTLSSEQWNSHQEISHNHVAELVNQVMREGCWTTTRAMVSNPYRGEPTFGDSTTFEYAQTYVGDEYDTSPFESTSGERYISTLEYIRNVHYLLRYLQQTHKHK